MYNSLIGYPQLVYIPGQTATYGVPRSTALGRIASDVALAVLRVSLLRLDLPFRYVRLQGVHNPLSQREETVDLQLLGQNRVAILSIEVYNLLIVFSKRRQRRFHA